MDRDLRRSVYISGFVHVALIIAAIITLPLPPLPTSPDDGVEVSLIGLPPQRAFVKNVGTATAVSQVVHHTDALTQNQPKNNPLEAPPPPPPPPPKSTAQVSPKQVTATAPPPPPKPSIVPSTVPPPPVVPPQKVTSTTPTKDKPVPKKATSMKSATHQQHVVKTPRPLSQSVLNTLMDLKALQKQTQPPKAVYNPDQNTAPTVGGSPNSTANSQLTGADRAGIASHLQPCFGVDAEAEGLGSFAVLLNVETDGTGMIRTATISPQNTGDMSNPLYYAFTQRALGAVLDYQCANIGPYLPASMLGQNQTFTFLYEPGNQQ